jgi:hypothetical protein
MSYKITNRQQAKLDELKAFHYDECPSIDWEKEANEPFSKETAGPKEKTWIDKEQKFSTSFFSGIVGVNKLMAAYYKFNKKRGQKTDKALYKEWEENYPFAKSMLEGNQASWREAIKKHATFHHNRDIAEAFSLHVHDEKIAECDVYLHTLDKIIPHQIEKTTKRGYLRYHAMPKTKRYALYELYVYSCLCKITNDLFAVLPCSTLFLHGLSGSYEDHHPIFSSVIERNQHKSIRCPKQMLTSHRHMAAFKKRSGFYPLNRVYSPQVLFSKEQ